MDLHCKSNKKKRKIIKKSALQNEKKKKKVKIIRKNTLQKTKKTHGTQRKTKKKQRHLTL